jgi:hypothetical protein
MNLSINTLRMSLVSFSLAAFALVGCAAPGAETAADDNADNDVNVTIQSADAVTAKSLTLVQPTQPVVSPIQGVQIVAPQCRAVLVSTTPTDNGGSFYPSCSFAANPHLAQRRIAGYIESTITDLRDQADPSHLVCKPSLIKGGAPICSMTPDRVIEKLCNETRVYDCPCGVETTMVEGAPAGYCRTMPR